MELDDLFKKNRHDGAADQSTLQLSDTRKSRLTLEQINKMRRIREAKKIEEYEKLKRIKLQYGKDSGSE
ncbi:MAG: hypothetical protein ACKVJK_22370 [Methylophagaceae bacterium]|jgi:hypothetical protein|tara:strand:- start:1082 stop:1288 length:207 start_codon:yes stop_codon:yes gene_type:complete